MNRNRMPKEQVYHVIIHIFSLLELEIKRQEREDYIDRWIDRSMRGNID